MREGLKAGGEGQAHYLAQVRKFLEQEGFAPGKKLVVAVSGGPDSLALLYILASLREPLDLQLVVAHLDHKLRGHEAEEDARFVERTSRSLGIEAVIGEANTLAHRAERHISLEEAARELRYAFLAQVAQEKGADAVALGHTADDQAETVLMHLIRGSGLAGLRGMEKVTTWKGAQGQRVVFLRPLIETTREETEGLCRSLGLTPRRDASNLSPRFLRNRVRLEVLPLLQSLNPRVKEALLRLSRALSHDLAFVEGEVSRVWGSVVTAEPGRLHLKREAFSALHPALKRHLLRRGYRHLKGDVAGLAQVHVEDMVALLEGPAGRTLHLPHGVVLEVGYATATLGLAKESPDPLPPLDGCYELQVPGETRIPGWEVRTSLIPGGVRVEGSPGAAEPALCLLDWEKVRGKLWVRHRRPGDRFHPLGLSREKKLQDFMVDAHIPRAWRDRVPLVVSEQGIVWVVGWRIAQWARVTPETRQGLRVEFRRCGSSGGWE